MADEDLREASEYTKMMLDQFVDEYDRRAAENGCSAMVWNALPHGVRKALALSFVAAADQIQGDMH